MKKLLLIILIASVLFACKEEKKPKLPEPPKQELQPDVVLEKPDHDSVQMLKHDSVGKTLRRKPKPQIEPIDTMDAAPVMPPTILIDFDGHVTSGTMWNVYGDFTVEGAGLDTTQQRIIIDSVNSGIRQFQSNIFVTTDERKFWKAPANQRLRVVVTVTNWYCTNCGGVAYLNSFIWTTEEPAFVFSALHGFRIRNIADAILHEAGHTLGNRHQSLWVNGVKQSEYNWGGGGVAPYMGASYNEPKPMWWVGLNSINQMQNDTLVIKSKLQ